MSYFNYADANVSKKSQLISYFLPSYYLPGTEIFGHSEAGSKHHYFIWNVFDDSIPLYTSVISI